LAFLHQVVAQLKSKSGCSQPDGLSGHFNGELRCFLEQPPFGEQTALPAKPLIALLPAFPSVERFPYEFP